MTEAQAPAGEFTGRRILLTGATGSIGRTAALRLAEAGAHVVLNGRDLSKLEKTAEALPAGSFSLAAYDLANADGIPEWMRVMAEKDGPFAGVAHTAGLQVTRPIRAINAEFINMILHANVTTGLMLAKGLRHKTCHTDNAALVLVSSTASRIGGAGNSAYAASKGAVISATKALAHELLRDKIRVNCVVPGLIDSEMAERAREATPPESWKVLLSGYPMGIGQPDDIAHAIVYLLSDRSRWMTGTELQLDGGLSII